VSRPDLEIVQKIPKVQEVPEVQSRLWRDAVGVTGIVMWIDPITYQDRYRYRNRSSFGYSRNIDRIIFNVKNYLWRPTPYVTHTFYRKNYRKI